MNRLVGFFFLLMCASCAVIGQDEDRTSKATVDDAASFFDNPYRLNLQLRAMKDKRYELMATVELDSACYFVSPYSSDTYKGYFKLNLNENEWLHLDSNFVESPRSVAKLDRWQGGMSHFVEETTSYSYSFTVNSKDDFKVLGLVQFVIEPKCTLEEIPFSITMKEGELSIQKYPKLDNRECPKKT